MEQTDGTQLIHLNSIRFANYNDLTGFRIRFTQQGDALMQYDVGSGFVAANSGWTITWHPGFDFGESEKVGDDTQMTSHHRNLRYLRTDWSEHAWIGMKCVKDEAPGWSWSPLSGSSNDYDVVNVGGNDPCDQA